VGVADPDNRTPQTLNFWFGHLLIISLLILGFILYYEQELLEKAIADAHDANSAYQYSQLERDLLTTALGCRDGSLNNLRLITLRQRSQLAVDSQNFHWLSPESQQTLRRLSESLQQSNPASWPCELFSGWASIVHPVVIEAMDVSNATRARLLVKIRNLRRDTVLGLLVVILFTTIVLISTWRASRRQREKIASLESEKAFRERLVGTIAHELRTPIATISGFAELLDRGDENSEHIARIKRMAQRLKQALADFLDLHRLQSDHPLVINKNRLDLKALLQEALDITRAQYPQTVFELEAPPEPVWVVGDEMRLLSAIQNLLSNGAKYGPQGAPVKARLFCQSDQARIEIEDGGPPLSAEEARAVFEPWTRLVRHQQLEGYGLGLPVVREVVRLHGGDIGWQARGSKQVFWLQIPCQKSSR